MAFTSFSFTVLPPLSSTSSPSPSPSSCSPNLWDPSSLSIYGIQTFPSGLTFLPSSLRSNPFHITTKSLSPCNSIQMSKDILPPAKIDWAFLDPIPLELNGVDPNDWANGTQLVIPESILLNRQAFPPNEPVGLQVNATFRVEESGKMVSFLAETYVQFLYAPVDVVTTPRDLSSIFLVNNQLVIDLTDSSTSDGIEVGDWEWEWECVTPTGLNEEGDGNGRECLYEGGKVVEMPGEEEGRFEAEDGERFEEGVPLYFVVRVRVRESGGNVVTEGSWEKVFNPVRNGGGELGIVTSEWVCEGSAVGYLVRFISNEGEIIFSGVSSLWSEDDQDFGQVEVSQVSRRENDGVTQIQCKCGDLCSEPLFVRVEVEIEGEGEHIIHFIYQPSGVLPPLQGEGCSTVIENYDGSDGLVSGLSFLAIACDDAYFLNGIATQQIWFEVVNDGTIVSGPIQYPPPDRNYFGSLQFFLSCGFEVSVYSRSIGFGFGGAHPAPSFISSQNYAVDSWTNALEEQLINAQGVIESSPNPFLNANFEFSLLQTMTLPCFASGTFSPLDPQSIIEAILSSPIPLEVNEILIEASFIAVSITSQSSSEQEAIIRRLTDYLEIVEAEGNSQQISSLGVSIIGSSSKILGEPSNGIVKDDTYGLVESLETALVCSLECGQEASVLLSDNVDLGASFNLLNNLATFSLDGVTFQLPENLDELQSYLGGKGECVQMGYSFISTEDDEGIPTASLAFFSINCDNGTWEEIPVTLSDSFEIFIPIEESDFTTEKESNCGEDVIVCVSGGTLSSITDPDGCELISQTETSITCACTHLTAFSALFTPNGNDCGDWEWRNIHTIAASFLTACIFLIVIGALSEHYLYHKPMVEEMNRILEDIPK